MLKIALPFGVGTPEEKRGRYRASLREAGMEPLEDIATLDGAAGLLLAGGTDLDPALYGAERRPETDAPDHARDALEIALLRDALARDLPVLAICRGVQLLNVAMGGTLAQHIEGHRCPKQREVHDISIAPGSRLANILGCREYVVNSRHHQAVDRPAPGVAVTATAPDGVIEAIEIPEKRFVLGVQWHPEARTDGPDRRLFEAFRAAAALPAADATVIETARLRLRVHRIEDLADSAALWGDTSVTRYIGGRPQSREETWGRILRYLGHWTALGYGYWAVEEKETGAFVGEVGYMDFQRDITPPLANDPEMGWVLTPGAQGKGYATEAVNAACAWGDARQWRRTVCLIHPENAASLRVAAKCGFREFARTAYRAQPVILFERP